MNTNKKIKEKKINPFLENDEVVLARNIVFDTKGKVKRLGYKSLRGLIQTLRRVNKNCLKFDTRLQFQIRLPLKP